MAEEREQKAGSFASEEAPDKDDVEAHVKVKAQQEASDEPHDDDDDDVEAHVKLK
jgi:hypothetical protein